MKGLKEVKVLFTGGGTGGHVSPAIAIAEILEERGMLDDCLFVGRDGGEENEAITKRGYNLSTINVSPIPRKISIKAVSASYSLLRAFKEAKAILKGFKPDIVVATGGYVSYPILQTAIKMKIPTAIHESNAYPGLVTRRLGPKCNVVLLGMDMASEYLKKCKRIVKCGTPVKKEFFSHDYYSSRKRLGIKPDEKLIVSFGGSGGADTINRTILNMMASYNKSGIKIRHIHAVGRKNYESALNEYKSLIKTTESSKCKIVPYIDDMPLLLSAADLTITRSGAMTISELAVTSTQSILIPSPNVAANHQYYNALFAKEYFSAHIIEEKCLSAEILTDTAYKMLSSWRTVNTSDLMKRRNNSSKCEDIIAKSLQSIAIH